MLLLHQFKTIFIKSRKTAGTSVEIWLSAYAKHEDDIVTPIMAEDEALRNAQGVFAKNYLDPANLKKMKYWNHIPAKQVRQRVGSVWEEYFKFTIERHPYEKAVSMAWFQFSVQENKWMDFDSCLNDTVEKGLYRNYDLYAENGTVLVDRVLRYENLQDELNAIAHLLGIPKPIYLPQAKTKFRQDMRPAVEILSPHQKQKIYAHCKEEFLLHSYVQ